MTSRDCTIELAIALVLATLPELLESVPFCILRLLGAMACPLNLELSFSFVTEP